MKTPEEAAQKYAKKIWKNGRAYRSRIGYSAEDFLAGYAYAIAKVGEAQKWVNVKDELPEPSVPYHEIYYLVKCSGWSDSDYSIASYNKEGEWISDELGEIMTKYVTHWKYIEQ